MSNIVKYLREKETQYKLS